MAKGTVSCIINQQEQVLEYKTEVKTMETMCDKHAFVKWKPG